MLHLLLYFLTAVFSQGLADGLDHAFIEQRSSPQLAGSLGTHPHIAVGLAGGAMLDLAIGGQAESFLGSLVCF